MFASFQQQFTVPFHELDPLRVMWHGHYLKYFDRVRFGLFDHVGIDLYHYLSKKNLVFPITRTSLKHIAPLGPNDTFTCRAVVTEARYKIAMAFEIRRPADRNLCTRGTSEQVAVRRPDMEPDFEIPVAIQKALGQVS